MAGEVNIPEEAAIAAAGVVNQWYLVGDEPIPSCDVCGEVLVFHCPHHGWAGQSANQHGQSANQHVVLASSNGAALAVLRELVELKDGPRDDHYRATKDAAWERARRVLGEQETKR